MMTYALVLHNAQSQIQCEHVVCCAYMWILWHICAHPTVPMYSANQLISWYTSSYIHVSFVLIFHTCISWHISACCAFFEHMHVSATFMQSTRGRISQQYMTLFIICTTSTHGFVQDACIHTDMMQPDGYAVLHTCAVTCTFAWNTNFEQMHLMHAFIDTHKIAHKTSIILPFL
jgi:hypothetical protein